MTKRQRQKERGRQSKRQTEKEREGGNASRFLCYINSRIWCNITALLYRKKKKQKTKWGL